jgi:hypothetical protein
MLQLLVDVVWPSGRVIHVRVRGVPKTAERGEENSEDAIAIQREDVDSLTSFQDFMRARTRILADGDTVDCFGMESDVAQVFALLRLEGQPTSYILKLPEE